MDLQQAPQLSAVSLKMPSPNNGMQIPDNSQISTQPIQQDPTTSDNPIQQNPDDIAAASSLNGDQSYNGDCQQFVEQMAYGRSGIFPSAVDAWNAYSKNGIAKQDLQNAKPGDLIYFAPDQSNGGYGHVGIYAGGDSMISATYNGVQASNVSDWQQQTGQRILGYVPIGDKNAK